MPQEPPFKCPNCSALYQVVRVEADDDPVAHDDLACPVCDGPLRPRDGRFILKYFLVDRPRRYKPRPPASVIASVS